MNNETMTDGDPMEAITAKKQADAERAEMNRQAEEAAEEARIWPTPPGQCPVVPLGWNGGVMHFWSHAYRQLIQLPKLGKSYEEIVRLAPLEAFYAWLSKGTKDSEKEVFCAVTRRLAEDSAQRKYREENILGRGVWYADREKKEIIYSAGERCYMVTVSGEFKELNTCVWRGKIYTSDKKNTLPAAEPLTDAEGQGLIDFLNLRPWKSHRAGEMVAGWMVCSMLSGLLTTRPQLWINAPAGTGKSRLRDDMAAAFGGVDAGYVCSVDGGKTTEPGLRRAMDREAVPVLFDEAESGEDESSTQNIDGILKTIRLVATAKDLNITQAEKNGGTVSYRPRFCAALFSVNNPLERETDISRFFILRMSGKLFAADKEKRYAELDRRREQLERKDFAPRLLRRVLECAHDVIQNAGTLAEAMKKKLTAAGCRTAERTADQLAHIMAGAYALTHRGPISQKAVDDYAAAAVLIDEDRSEEVERKSETELALEELLTHTVTLSSRGGFTIAKLCQIMEAGTDTDLKGLAENALETCGLRWNSDKEGKTWLAVNTSFSGFKKIFRNSTINANGFRRALKRDDDCIGIREKSTRFKEAKKGPVRNALQIPGDYVLDYVLNVNIDQ